MVFGEIPRRRAISLLDLPREISWETSRSRPVSRSIKAVDGAGFPFALGLDGGAPWSVSTR